MMYIFETFFVINDVNFPKKIIGDRYDVNFLKVNFPKNL